MKKIFCAILVFFAGIMLPTTIFAQTEKKVEGLSFVNGTSETLFCPPQYLFKGLPKQQFPYLVNIKADNLNAFNKGVNFYYRSSGSRSVVKIQPQNIVIQDNNAELKITVSLKTRYEVIAKGISDDEKETVSSSSLFLNISNTNCLSEKETPVFLTLNKNKFFKDETLQIRITNLSSSPVKFNAQSMEVTRKISENKTPLVIKDENGWETVSYVSELLKLNPPCDCSTAEGQECQEDPLYLLPEKSAELTWNLKNNFCYEGEVITNTATQGQYIAAINYAFMDPVAFSQGDKEKILYEGRVSTEFQITGGIISQEIDQVLNQFTPLTRHRLKLTILILPILLAAIVLFIFRDL